MMHRSSSALLAGIGVCLCALSPLRTSAAEQEDGRRPRSLRSDPPRLLSLEITPLDAHTVRTVAEYAPDPRLGERLTLGLENGPVTFTRGADGRYSADMRLTDQEIAELKARDEKLRHLRFPAIHNDYNGRLLVGTTIATPLSLFSLRTADQRTGELPAPMMSNAQAYLAVGALVPDPMSVLMITDRKVVGDCARTWDPCDPASRATNGVWTFAHLMRSLPGVTDPAKLTESWLKTWSTDQTVGTITAKARPGITDVLASWPRDTNNALDLDQAPLRLLAIVNRPDLADNLTFPASAATTATDTAGELRFVFDVAPIVDTDWGKQCAVKKFQVIFEYRVAASTCDDVKQWAQRWIDLAAFGRGTDDYNQKLAEITEDVVVNHKGVLAQVRTNEIDLASGTQKLWEMREFALTGSGASLALTERAVRRTPQDTPDFTINHSATLSVLVNGKAQDILHNAYEISGSEGANPQMAEGTYWDGARGTSAVQINDPAVRFSFSLNACTGCHARETCTKFNQVIPGKAGEEACLSQFLAGDQNVPDPVFCTAQECSKPGIAVCPPSPTATVVTPVATATAATPTPAAGTPTITATRTCHQLPTATATAATPAAPSVTSTSGAPAATATPVAPSATATAGTPVATSTVTATAMATATYNACTYKPNDLERRRQVLDQLTMCSFPNGYVRLDATH